MKDEQAANKRLKGYLMEMPAQRFFAFAIMCLAVMTARAVEQLTVPQLLYKFAQTQNKLGSFRVTGKCTIKAEASFWSGVVYSSGLHDVRGDGERISTRISRWGEIEPGRQIPENEPAYSNHTWDGNNYLRYSKGSGSGGTRRVVISTKQSSWEVKRLQTGHIAGPLWGFFAGAMDRVDVVLRGARDISIRRKIEQVNGFECYVVDAETNWGRYTVWFDRNHGHNIAKASVEYAAGKDYLFYGQPFDKAGKKMDWSIEITGFKEVGDVWVPTQARQINYRVFDDKCNYERSQATTTLTEVIANPDHKRVRSFLPDDIPNGVDVFIVGAKGNPHTWQNGKVVDETGKVIMDFN
jgi:hypothetical protein